MDIGPIFFKEISFFDFLEESTRLVIRQWLRCRKGESRNKIPPSYSRSNVHFAKVQFKLETSNWKLPLKGLTNVSVLC